MPAWHRRFGSGTYTTRKGLQFPRPERLHSALPGGRRPQAELGPSAGSRASKGRCLFPCDGRADWGPPSLESRERPAPGGVGEPGPCCPTWGWGSGRRSLQGAGGLEDSCPPPTPQAEGSLPASAGEDELASLLVANAQSAVGNLANCLLWMPGSLAST